MPVCECWTARFRLTEVRASLRIPFWPAPGRMCEHCVWPMARTKCTPKLSRSWNSGTGVCRRPWLTRNDSSTTPRFLNQRAVQYLAGDRTPPSAPRRHYDRLQASQRLAKQRWGSCDLSRRCTHRRRAADGRSVTETTMRSVEVVMLEPGGELQIAFLRVEVVANVGPLAQGGLDEAFGLAIGARSVGTGESVLDAELEAGSAELS